MSEEVSGSDEVVAEDLIKFIADRHGLTIEAAQRRIGWTKKNFYLATLNDAADFLATSLPNPKPVICDGCRVKPGAEHRCSGEDAVVNSEATGVHCQCPRCSRRGEPRIARRP